LQDLVSFGQEGPCRAFFSVSVTFAYFWQLRFIPLYSFKNLLYYFLHYSHTNHRHKYMQTSGILVERYRVSPRSNFSAKNKSPRRERLLEYLEYLWGHSVYRNIAPSASNGDAQVRDLGIALYNAKGNHRHCTSTYGWHIAESRNFLLRTRNKFHVISISTVLFPDLHTGGGTCLYFCYSAHLSSARTCTAYVLVFPSTRREIRMSCLTKR
jgi:hypothetical protein